MKKKLTTLVLATTLMGSFAHAAEAKSESELRDLMKKIAVETNDINLSSRRSLVESKISALAKGQDSQTAAGLNKKLQTQIGGEAKSVNPLAIADVIVRAHADLEDGTKVSHNNMDAEAKKLHDATKAALEIYAQGIGLISAHIATEAMGSKEAQAATKVLMMGQEIAQGRLSLEEINEYTSVVSGMISKIRGGDNSQLAIKATLKILGYDVDGKIDELVKCKLMI